MRKIFRYMSYLYPLLKQVEAGEFCCASAANGFNAESVQSEAVPSQTKSNHRLCAHGFNKGGNVWTHFEWNLILGKWIWSHKPWCCNILHYWACLCYCHFSDIASDTTRIWLWCVIVSHCVIPDICHGCLGHCLRRNFCHVDKFYMWTHFRCRDT